MNKQLVAMALLALSMSLPVIAQNSKNKAPGQNAVNDILNASLGSVGQAVVVTVSSAGEKDKEYYAQIPGDKYSHAGNTIQPLGLAEISARISAAFDRAKKDRKANTITIKIEVKQPSGGRN